MIVDIREYPGAIAKVNELLTAGREIELKMENENIAVADHIRVFQGLYAKGKTERGR